MRRRVPGVRRVTLDKIFAQAQEATFRSEASKKVLKGRVMELMGDVDRYNRRMDHYRTRIEDLGRALQHDGLLCRLDEDVSGLTLYNLARIAGEAGPFTDFHSRRALLRYAGLNLRERQSRRYRGRTRLSKKGRIMLRKAAAQATFPLLRHDRLFGEMYARKRAGGMCAQKVKVAVMRKFLVVVYATSLSGRTFNAYRFTNAARSISRPQRKQMVC